MSKTLRSRGVAVAVAIAAPTVASLGFFWYRHWAEGTPDMVRIELAGSADTIRKIIKSYPGRYVDALHADFRLILSYVIATVAGASLGWSLSFTQAARRLSLLAMGAGIVAALCDVGEDLALLHVIEHGGENGFAVVAQGLAFTKFVLLMPAAVVALVAVVTTLWRARPRRLRTYGRPSTANPGHDELPWCPVGANDDRLAHEPNSSEGVRRSAWRTNTYLPPSRRAEPGRDADTIGICVSGGGIRSATFALGALDALRPVLKKARYLVSVSGGGYCAGALQLALQRNRPEELTPEGFESVANPDDVYSGGSAELDHTRRHGNYIADDAKQWLVALGAVLRGVVVSVGTLVLTVVVLGRLLAHLYASLSGDVLKTPWPPLPGVQRTIGLLAAPFLLAWLGGVWLDSCERRACVRLRRWFARVRRYVVATALLVAVAGIGVPLLAWTGGWITSPRAVPLGSIALVVVGWLSALIGVGQRPASRKIFAGLRRAWGATVGSRQRSITAAVAVFAGLLVIVIGLLLLLGNVIATTGAASVTTRSWPWLKEWQVTAIAAAAFGVIAVADQVRWSLHPFYRRRLATAFAVRRERREGRVRAERYDYDNVRTTLHEYAGVCADFPRVIFLCAAHVSGQELTPPGRQVVPWTMSGDYVGSPVLGWMPSKALHDEIPPLLRYDLTVQAAQAISGAAFASQMGRMQRPITRLLTLTNVRLGSWLPNPDYLGRRRAELREGNGSMPWWLPAMPRRRYLVTWARELIGSYPADGPLVFVTDGGHYENLGLVELLRHRCRYICCIDGSGDRPNVARTLAQAVELAYEELGVTIELDHPERLSAGHEGPQRPPPDQLLGELEDRLAQDCTIIGRITYPDLGPDLPKENGYLVIGKAVLTRATPFEVLAHATGNPSFPNDSTADQWFDFTRFDAYHTLGRHVGKSVLSAMKNRPFPSGLSLP
ncbi:hypothetical protein [Nonomuraea sp. NPDC049141]|uniref:hypothetical protein n=1 Tax=Nonomuraea sp. NPDC049141 TaxID=3155500 RepID=UPI0034090178